MAPVDDADALAGVSGDTLAPSALAPGQYKEYTADGGFSTATGRFTPQSLAGDNYWATKGIPNDRAAAGSTCRGGVPQLTALASRGGRARLLAAPRTREKRSRLRRPGSSGSALCVRRALRRRPPLPRA